MWGASPRSPSSRSSKWPFWFGALQEILLTASQDRPVGWGEPNKKCAFILRWGYLQWSSDRFVSWVFRFEYADPMNSHHYLGVSCCPHPTSNPSAHLGGPGQDDRSPGILGLLQARQRARELGTLALYILSRSSWHASSIIRLSIWLVALNLDLLIFETHT